MSNTAARYDYNKPCVTSKEAMELLGYVDKDTFNHRLLKSGVEYQHGVGRRPTLLSISAINVLAKKWEKPWVTIPDEIKGRALVSVEDVSVREAKPVEEKKAEPPKKQEVAYWERKAKALAELYDMDLEDVLNEAVRQYIDKMTEAKA